MFPCCQGAGDVTAGCGAHTVRDCGRPGLPVPLTPRGVRAAVDSGRLVPAVVGYRVTKVFELTMGDLTWPDDLKALGAVDGWLPSGLPNGFNDPVSREQIVFVRGRANPDTLVDLSDAIFVLQFLFRDGPAPRPMVAADINDDNRVDLADPIYLLDYIFRGRQIVPYPYPEPGQDLTK